MPSNSASIPMRDFGRTGVKISAVAGDGHNELFKMTVKYDGKIGREQHHFPSEQELPL